MNNILDHKGYRFFQASFDPDEKGTILSVNKDFWGTFITYSGYLLLFFSMSGIFFIGETRFKSLSRQLNKKTLSVLFFITAFSVNAQNDNILDKTDFIE